MAKIVDSDAHVVEPRALWEDYVEPAFRGRIPKIVKDSDGVDRFAVGQPPRAGSIYAPAAMCIPGGLGRPELARELSWDDLRPGSYDPDARIRDMDAEGIDVCFLYPSLALAYPAIREPEVAAAGCRAYNNWMADFCGAYPNRLYSVAPVPLFDIDAAVAEMRRVRKEHGVRAILVRPNPHGERLLSDPAYDPFWREAQELDCTISVHGAVGGDMPTVGFDRYRDFFRRMIISHPFELQMACMDLICGGVLDRFPRLRFAFLEAGGLWASYWLARMDEFHGKIGHLAPNLRMKPSEYFRRQCFCSCEPDDVALRAVESLDAGDLLMWASDYPHFDCEYPGAVDELREHCAGLHSTTQEKIMGGNAERCYGIN